MNPFFSTQKPLIILCTLFLLLNLPAIFHPASPEEQLYLNWSNLPFWQISLTLHQHGEIPPLYPMLLNSVGQWIPALWGLRLFSLFLGTALLWWGYRLGSFWHQRLGQIAALGLGLLLSIRPEFSLSALSFASTIHTDSLSALLGAISLYYLWRWIQTRRDDAFYTFELSILLMWVTTPLSLPWLLCCNLVFLSAYGFYRDFFQIMQQRWWLGQLFILLGGAFWIKGHYDYLASILHWWLPGILLPLLACVLWMLWQKQHSQQYGQHIKEPEALRIISLAFIASPLMIRVALQIFTH